MKINVVRMLAIVVIVVGAMAVVGCKQKSPSTGVAERTGAALDRAAEKTVETTKEVAGEVVEKTGEVLEKTGAAIEETGAGMQK